MTGPSEYLEIAEGKAKGQIMLAQQRQPGRCSQSEANADWHKPGVMGSDSRISTVPQGGDMPTVRPSVHSN